MLRQGIPVDNYPITEGVFPSVDYGSRLEQFLCMTSSVSIFPKIQYGLVGHVNPAHLFVNLNNISPSSSIFQSWETLEIHK